MRKKTVKFVADTIFWYVLYFLPIVSYLLFCFSEPISYLTVADNTVTEPTEIVQVIEETQTEYVIPAGEYVLNETLLPYFGSDASISSEVLIPFEFTSYNGSRDITFFGFYFQKLNTDFDLLRYADIVPLPDLPETVYDFCANLYVFPAYRSITLNTDAIIDNFTFYSWFAENSSFDILSEPEPEPEPEQSTLKVVSFTNYITSAFSFLEDNVFYTSLDGAIGANGLCPLISDKGLLLYLSWFVSVYIAHLFVDFVLFIPRLAHKWLNAFTQGD